MAENTLRRILFVEDDPDIQKVAKLALEALGGFSVLPCSSGPEALAAVAGFAPDLVLLDVMMPGMDGPATLAALRQIPGALRLPAVFLTARVQAHEVAGYKAMGAVDVIAKPFDPMRLAETVLGIWQALHSPELSAEENPLNELRESFRERLDERVREIEEAWEAARAESAAGGAREPLLRLHRLAHSLYGTAGTFGHPAVGDAARDLERRVEALLDVGDVGDLWDLAELAPLLAALSGSAGRAC